MENNKHKYKTQTKQQHTPTNNKTQQQDTTTTKHNHQPNNDFVYLCVLFKSEKHKQHTTTTHTQNIK